MIDLTRRVATAWRGFLGSEEGQIGLLWILEQRPPLDTENWQRASGFEEFKKRIDQLLEHDRVRNRKDEEEDILKP
jgi:hypothetical protein